MTLDHLVYATPDLAETVDRLQALLGVRPGAGGQHPGRGTANALLALGGERYLEVVGPDPDQPAPAEPRWLGVDGLVTPRLVTWSARAHDLATLVAQARGTGLDLGDVIAGSRTRPDGTVLSWELTDPRRVLADGLVPFFIDWGASAHPAATAPSGVTLGELRAEHPEPDAVRDMLRRLDVELPVGRAQTPALVATLQTPHGPVELR